MGWLTTAIYTMLFLVSTQLILKVSTESQSIKVNLYVFISLAIKWGE